MSKYNAKKVECDGIVFDSIVEKRYYEELKIKKMNGEIKSFSIQPTYQLIPKFEKFGVKYRAMTYTPDFLIINNDDTETLVDIKGFGTLASELRKKLFDYLYQDKQLIWLSYSKKWGGFVEYKELQRLRKVNKKSE